MRVVAFHTIPVQHGLDHPPVGESARAPFRGIQIAGGTVEGLAPVGHGGVQPRFVASDASLRLARHEVRETPHALQGPAFSIQRHEIEGNARRHVETGRTVGFNGHFAQHVLGRIGGSAGNDGELEPEGPHRRVDPDGLGHFADHP